MSAKAFLDTNVLFYAFAADEPRNEPAEALVSAGGTISVQVLNEFANVSRRKLGRDWREIEAQLQVVRALLDPPVPVTVAIHEAGLTLARDHGFALYDALIVAAAIEAGCSVLYSENMHDGRAVGGLTVRNPFV